MFRILKKNRKIFLTSALAVVLIILVLAIYINFNKTELINPPTAISVGNIESIDALTIDDLYILNDGNVNIIYEPGTKVPREIEGKFTTNRILNQQDAAVALMGLRELLLISEYDFYCYSVYEGGTEGNEVTTFQLVQLHEGVPVDSGFRITASKSGEPISVRGKFMEVGDDIETDPVISYKDGLDLIDLEPGTYVRSAQLVISKMDEKGLRLCWVYETESRDNPTDGKYAFIDAITGEFVIEFTIAVS